ncbi:MAG: ImmA/IrrE family metallo-endopeptidase [Pseudolabrys sp.]|jgi:Zn-dependent peptidase ImmA (M78 family)
MTVALTAAERILQSLGIEDPKEIDLEAIAWTQGAAVNYRPLDDCEARIIGSRRKAVISVNSRSPAKRRRFSLAHELGHWHLHRGQVLFCGKEDIANFANDAFNPEQHADAFASDLVLPNYIFVPRVRKLKRVTLAAAREVSDEFCVSLTATLLKMTLSNEFPTVIACYNKTKRRWFQSAPMIQPWWRPLRALDRQTFAAEMLFNGGAEENFPRKMPAEAWFDFKGSDRFEVSEQSFLLPDEEILTVLTLPDEAIT